MAITHPMAGATLESMPTPFEHGKLAQCRRLPQPSLCEGTSPLQTSTAVRDHPDVNGRTDDLEEKTIASFTSTLEWAPIDRESRGLEPLRNPEYTIQRHRC
jgi:hypothetical protein